MGIDPEPWGPTVGGGVRHRLLRRLLAAVAVVSLVGVAAVATTGYLLYLEADARFDQDTTRVTIPGGEGEAGSTTGARHFLLVGSDDRAGLSRQEQRALTLGTEEEFGGQRSDTVIYVRVSADRSQVSLTSIPRDLVVRTESGGQGKLTDQFVAGPAAVIEALERTYGLTVNHYAQVSLGGFIDVVDTIGGVTIELENPLVDRLSGAQFADAGSYDMDAAEALSYVRSRIGTDYARMDRQQNFIRAVVEQATSAGTLANPARLSRLIEDVAGHLTIDDRLELRDMVSLGMDLRGVVGDGMPMMTFPSYSVDLPPSPGLPGGSYVLPYEPGARALQEAIASGEPLPETATRDQAAEIRVAMVPGNNVSAAGNVLGPTLVYANYIVNTWSSAPEDVRVSDTTVVYRTPGNDTEAGWVAALLGADVRDLPPDVEVPDGTDVVVAVGADAAGTSAMGAP